MVYIKFYCGGNMAVPSVAVGRAKQTETKREGGKEEGKRK
jgi:hypothetical protein